MDFDEFMTILGPKLVSSEGRDGFLGNTIDSIFWQVSELSFNCNFSNQPAAEPALSSFQSGFVEEHMMFY